MRIANYEVRAVHAGEFALDGGAMFGVVPQPLWRKRHPPDDRNRIALALRCLLLRGEERTILVDTGTGRKFSEKYLDIYRIDQDRHDLIRSLEAAGVGPEDVTDVVISHLHFDHAGGATVKSDGRIRPTFPRAAYHVQEENWKAATDANELERRSYLAENFMPLKEAGLLTLHKGEEEIAPGVSLIPSKGHTPGMHLVRVAGDDQTLLFCADLIPTASHIHIPFIMAYDLYPATILEEKKRVLSQAASEGWILYFYHDPEIAAARVKRDGEGFALAEEVQL